MSKSDLKDLLRLKIEMWVGEISLPDIEEVSGAIAETNGIYLEESCEHIVLEEEDDKTYSFTSHVTMHGEPRKDDVPFAGETIEIDIKGEVSFNDELDEWVVDDDFYEVSAWVKRPDFDTRIGNPGLRRISIENFKGIGPRVDIDLRPVTLLFGPNSIGKSTILHAIHCAHAILETSNPDVGTTLLGGRIDLGGFKNYVHNHDLDTPVTLGFEFVPDEEDLPVQFQDGRVKTIRVEFSIRYSHYMERPVVERYKVDYNGSTFAEFTTNLDSGETRATHLTYSHEVLPSDLDFPSWETEDDIAPAGLVNPEFDMSTEPPTLVFPPDTTEKQRKEWSAWNEIRDEISSLNSQPTHGCLSGRKMALPYWDRPVDIDPANTTGVEDEELNDYFVQIGVLMQAAGVALRRQLERFRYVGPIRQAPPRNYLPPTRLDESRWASGLGAWDLLVRDGALRAEVSDWLRAENRLNTGYVVEWNDLRELKEITFKLLHQFAGQDDFDEKFRLLTADLPHSGRLAVVDVEKSLPMAPCDLGEGIAQVVPVVAAALARTVTTPSNREEKVDMVAIEQPELHIHPRMQVVLGDLFLSQCAERQFLIETHSEHLMLRLLKRVREGRASTDDIAVLYVTQEEGSVRLKPLRLTDEGDFADSWPEGFFAERRRELF